MLTRLQKGSFSVSFPVLETTLRKWCRAMEYGTMLDVKVGYVRPSKREQNTELHLRELRAAGCERVYE